ncbi:hypothetical protein D0C36_20410 [Mucilaginibacter conchicola]|uniref:Uncharacterized protein n=1 Tax=Mucilaginibacter conchicola TaxID=2303333 RepID=A0A372NSG5_9SPHI|nr:hypothetical protein D0C36_20410 [Mucilaginibacter conchicola]
MPVRFFPNERHRFAWILRGIEIKGMPVADLGDHVPDGDREIQLRFACFAEVASDHDTAFAYELIDMHFLFCGRVEYGFIVGGLEAAQIDRQAALRVKFEKIFQVTPRDLVKQPGIVPHPVHQCLL